MQSQLRFPIAIQSKQVMFLCLVGHSQAMETINLFQVLGDCKIQPFIVSLTKIRTDCNLL